MDKLREFTGGEVERCGFILSSGEVVEVENVSSHPGQNFEISEEAFLTYVDTMTGLWHTHVNGIANLSLPDYYTFMDFPELEHWVVSDLASVCFKVEETQLIIDKVIWYEND